MIIKATLSDGCSDWPKLILCGFKFNGLMKIVCLKQHVFNNRCVDDCRSVCEVKWVVGTAQCGERWLRNCGARTSWVLCPPVTSWTSDTGTLARPAYSQTISSLTSSTASVSLCFQSPLFTWVQLLSDLLSEESWLVLGCVSCGEAFT